MRKKISTVTRRAQNLRSRYGITPEKYAEMLKEQGNVCALCENKMQRPVVDHCHVTGKVRGILCHSCNIKLPSIEDMGWVMLAWAYLERDDR